MKSDFKSRAADVAAISAILEPNWYKVRNPDIAEAGIHPGVHYLFYGAAEGRDPHPLFATRYYQQLYCAAERNSNPLIHYVQRGAKCRFNPHPLFDTEWYLGQFDCEVDNPLLHFLETKSEFKTNPNPLFDVDFYLRNNPDVVRTGLNPLVHYIEFGAKERRDPHPLFLTRWYLAQCGEGSAEIENPLMHFLEVGAKRNWSPHPLFDIVFYKQNNRDVEESGINPLVHYIKYGAQEGRRFLRLFDVEFYSQQCLAVGQKFDNPLVHFIQTGAKRSIDPHPLFSVQWYLEQNPDVQHSGMNPLVHYLSSGWREARSPHALFAINRYLLLNPDVSFAGIEPLSHYVSSGWEEGRSVHPLFDQEWYRRNNMDGRVEDPLADFLRSGARQGKDPNAFFDTDWYRRENETALGAGENPLAHYARVGWTEQRDPSPLFDMEYYLSRNQDVQDAGGDPLAHYLSVGRFEGRQPRRPDVAIDTCEVIDIPYEILRDPGVVRGRDACLFVTYTPDGYINEHVIYHLNALKAEKVFIVLVICTDGLTQPLPTSLDHVEGILLRSNHGWDFAAWAAALTIFPDLWSAESLILANDSVYGPTNKAHFAEIMNRVRSSSQDIVALTGSNQVVPHFMSYFVGLTRSGLASGAVRRFWAEVKSLKEKTDVIKTYELTSLTMWRDRGVDVEVLFPANEDDDNEPINPTLVNWRRLLQDGFPFLKVQLLRDKLPQVDPSGWEDALEANCELRTCIERHLLTLRAPKQKESRPIPAPMRRHRRRLALTTAFGAVESVRPSDSTDLALEVPFGFEVSDKKLPDRVAVIAHIFYPEMAEEFLEKFRNIVVDADLFISTDTEAKKSSLEHVFEAYSNGSVDVRVCPNVGRDIAPMLVEFRHVFEQYEIFLHVHSKKSPHDSRYEGWREFLLDNLLGSPDVVRSVLRLFAEPDVGIVFSQHLPAVRPLLNWGHDFDMVQALLASAGAPLRRDLVLEFPSSSFFWARSAALKPLLNLGLSFSDFSAELGQTDGTLAHAIERSLLFVAEGGGFRWSKVARYGNVPSEALIPTFDERRLRRDIRHVHRQLLGNPIRATSEALFTAELARAQTRPSRSELPRVNLIVPTLQPKQIFGGVTTALRTFKELSVHLGEDFDQRIICTTQPVGLDSMAELGSFRRAPLGGEESDELPRTVLDLTEADAGEIEVRRNDIYIATAWWTAHLAYELQSAQANYHGIRNPVIYLIQDHEPDFYGWSSRFAEARATYSCPEKTIALINSEELANYMGKHYGFSDAYVVRYQANSKIQTSMKSHPRERIILVYGRPNTDRNCFQILCSGLIQWQQTNPTLSRHWRIISAGEDYRPSRAASVQNLEVRGKLSLEDYADLLSRASLGISLMLSPHPSYPPLEMAYAGLFTITNAYEFKDLTFRNENFISLETLTADALGEAISKAVAMAENRIGSYVPFSEIRAVPCDLPDYDPANLAERLKGWLE